ARTKPAIAGDATRLTVCRARCRPISGRRTSLRAADAADTVTAGAIAIFVTLSAQRLIQDANGRIAVRGADAVAVAATRLQTGRPGTVAAIRGAAFHDAGRAGRA